MNDKSGIEFDMSQMGGNIFDNQNNDDFYTIS
jgi:hypothetical protein